MPSEEVILELEAAMEMVAGGLMILVQRRWMKAVAMEAAKKQMRAVADALFAAAWATTVLATRVA